MISKSRFSKVDFIVVITFLWQFRINLWLTKMIVK